MRRLPALLLALLVAACATQPATVPAPANVAALPDAAIDQRRRPVKDVSPDRIALYAAATGSYTSLFLYDSPGAAGQADGTASPALARDFEASLAVMQAAIVGRGGLPLVVRATVRRADGTPEMICAFTPIGGAIRLESLCSTLVGGRVAKVRATVANVPGNAQQVVRYAVAVSAILIGALRSAPAEPDAWGIDEPAPAATGPLQRT